MQTMRILSNVTLLNHLNDTEALKSGRLTAQVSDVNLLLNLVPVIASSPDDIPLLIDREVDPREKRQLNSAYAQINAYHTAIQETLTEANEEYTKWGFGNEIELINQRIHCRRFWLKP